ncbi:hypothetical protein AKJ09_06782 [Labilithrix luteola]|uniref:Uncharacterized protein n=1 Tax=Labilithrix luteola TaxID=1391654 RepID=A0A0K1Q2X2_9BACT|nr:hypothetical protein [Labilithrix luteola]AKV00119.1 hypothetical protein AKJ09_06782 [Labilithrix luteola]
MDRHRAEVGDMGVPAELVALDAPDRVAKIPSPGGCCAPGRVGITACAMIDATQEAASVVR